MSMWSTSSLPTFPVYGRAPVPWHTHDYRAQYIISNYFAQYIITHYFAQYIITNYFAQYIITNYFAQYIITNYCAQYIITNYFHLQATTTSEHCFIQIEYRNMEQLQQASVMKRVCICLRVWNNICAEFEISISLSIDRKNSPPLLLKTQSSKVRMRSIMLFLTQYRNIGVDIGKWNLIIISIDIEIVGRENCSGQELDFSHPLHSHVCSNRMETSSRVICEIDVCVQRVMCEKGEQTSRIASSSGAKTSVS